MFSMIFQNANLGSMSQTPQSARKCIVDQDGTVYVAMGHVSDKEENRGVLFGSKATLNSLGDPNIPRSPQQWRGSQNRVTPRSPATAMRLQGGRNGSGHTTPARLRTNGSMPPIFPSNGSNSISGISSANNLSRVNIKNQVRICSCEIFIYYNIYILRIGEIQSHS